MCVCVCVCVCVRIISCILVLSRCLQHFSNNVFWRTFWPCVIFRQLVVVFTVCRLQKEVFSELFQYINPTVDKRIVFWCVCLQFTTSVKSIGMSFDLVQECQGRRVDRQQFANYMLTHTKQGNVDPTCNCWLFNYTSSYDICACIEKVSSKIKSTKP